MKQIVVNLFSLCNLKIYGSISSPMNTGWASSFCSSS